jgi:hypothetical protein
MLGRRRRATRAAARARRPDLEATQEPLAEEPPARQVQEPLTLKTVCMCGHMRKEHRGLRMEDCGACLECECAGFTRVPEAAGSREQVSQEVHTALDQVARLQEIVATLRAQLNDGAGGR